CDDSRRDDGGVQLRQATAPPGALVLDGGEGLVFLEASLAANLRPHQEEGLEFMMRHVLADGGCILADSMGLGKTLQALSLLWVAFSRWSLGQFVVL
ncbi:unnamed protein product, partial [Polarella glacialis]